MLEDACKEMGLSDEAAEQITTAYGKQAEEKINKVNSMVEFVAKQVKIEREKFSAKHYKLKTIEDKKEINGNIPPINIPNRQSKRNSRKEVSRDKQDISYNLNSNNSISNITNNNKEKSQLNNNNILPVINQGKNAKLMNISGDEVKLDEINNMMRQIIDEF